MTGTFNQPTYTVKINVPAGIQYSLGGFPFTGSISIPLPAVAATFLSLSSPQATGAGTQATFVSLVRRGGAVSQPEAVTTSSITGHGNIQDPISADRHRLPGGRWLGEPGHWLL